MFPTNEEAARQRAWKAIRTSPSRGFTLVELMVSMAVLALVMALTVQLVGRATSITTASNKVVDSATMARTVFDRLGDDLASAALTGGPTVLHYSGTSSNDSHDPGFLAQNSAIGFVCKTRARKIVSDGASGTNQDVRGVVVAYKIRKTPITKAPGVVLSIPLINRGDAEFTYSKAGYYGGSNGSYDFSVWNLFGVAGTYPLPNDLVGASPTGDLTLLAWNGLGDGVLRFHVSFVLDDGRIVQGVDQTSNGITTKAIYNNFQAKGPATGSLTGYCQPIAFSAATTQDPNKRYVTGLIVGIAVLDETSLNFAYTQDTQFSDTLTAALKRPINDNETPVGVWQANLDTMNAAATSSIPLPVRRSLRFYQRFYAINL